MPANSRSCLRLQPAFAKTTSDYLDAHRVGNSHRTQTENLAEKHLASGAQPIASKGVLGTNQLARKRLIVEQININMQWLIPLATAACEDLQSRIYSILEVDGLSSLRKRYPDVCYAKETLYLIVRFFGWAVAVECHGRCTRDPMVMQLVSWV